MASINLLPRKVFEITLEDGTVIKGQFGTWALKRFCDIRKLSLGEAQDAMRSLGGIVDFILCAVEYTTRINGQPFAYTDINACQWADEMGGIDSQMFTSLIRHSQEEAPASEEKKTQPSPVAEP